jgi:hypothetical protein
MSSQRERITHFTTSEAGDWYPWTSMVDAVPEESYLQHMKQQATCGVTTLISTTIHAFKTSEGREWDCKNGWRLHFDVG